MSPLPNLFYFNPTCEMAVANGTVSWQPNRMLQQFESDLELLVAFLAQPSDVVLLRKHPSKSHLDHLKKAGFQLPQLVNYDAAIKDQQLLDCPKHHLKPWGWSPVMHRLLEPFKSSMGDSFKKSPNANWQEITKEYYSRKTALKVLSKVIETPIKGSVTSSVLPVICTSSDKLIAQHQQWGKSVIKAPWSSSGRGLQIIDRLTIDSSIINWSNGILKEQGYLMHEPFLNNQQDFAFQFEINDEAVEYLGTSWFYTNAKGAYLGNYLSKAYAPIQKNHKTLLDNLESTIVARLSDALSEQFLGNYQGLVGVDAMFVTTTANETVIHPCVEINLRTNMGNVAAALEGFSKAGFTRFEINTIAHFQSIKESTLLLTEGEKFCAYLR